MPAEDASIFSKSCEIADALGELPPCFLRAWPQTQEPPWPERVGKLRARAARELGANAWAKVHVVSLQAH